jgi:hypothetical protein
LDINWRKKPIKWYIWITAVYGAETWTMRTVYQKYLESFEMWFCRRMEKISWIRRVGNEVWHSVKEERNILHAVKRKKANWIGHILRRNFLIEQVTEGR